MESVRRNIMPSLRFHCHHQKVRRRKHSEQRLSTRQVPIPLSHSQGEVE